MKLSRLEAIASDALPAAVRGFFGESGETADHGAYWDTDGTIDTVGFSHHLQQGQLAATQLETAVNEWTLDTTAVSADFFQMGDGVPLVDRADLERTLPIGKVPDLAEVDRYWVNKPYAFVSICHSAAENELKYYLIEPTLTPGEQQLRDELGDKLQTTLGNMSIDLRELDRGERAQLLDAEIHRTLTRYGLWNPDSEGRFDRLKTAIQSTLRDGDVPTQQGGSQGESAADESPDSATEATDSDGETNAAGREIYESSGVPAEEMRTQPVPDFGTGTADGSETESETPADDGDGTGESGQRAETETLTEAQMRKIKYYLKREFVGFEQIDALKYDSGIEDISCDGYGEPVFVHHASHGQMVTNIRHTDTDDLDSFVIRLAQSAGEGISTRSPQVDATLDDGSRAQLTLGTQVSDKGSNYTIRQFTEVPHTPVDLIAWNTYSLEEMAFLWLCIESGKNILFSGGTASGKTTTLNALSLCIPADTKVVSIEDTREVELPQRNWISSVTRSSLSDDEDGSVDEFDLLEAALRQRPDYIVMGEVRGEEGRTLFQTMSTGHTVYTTFHAGSVDDIINRFTSEPINVSKSMFSTLDLVTVQTATTLDGDDVRRCTTIAELTDYDQAADEVNVSNLYNWEADRDTHTELQHPPILEDIATERGWSETQLDRELLKRKAILAYLLANEINKYGRVAAAIQGYNTAPDEMLAALVSGTLEQKLDQVREKESVSITTDDVDEAGMVRPSVDGKRKLEAQSVVDAAKQTLFGDAASTAGGGTPAGQEQSADETDAVRDGRGDADGETGAHTDTDVGEGGNEGSPEGESVTTDGGAADATTDGDAGTGDTVSNPGGSATKPADIEGDTGDD